MSTPDDCILLVAGPARAPPDRPYRCSCRTSVSSEVITPDKERAFQTYSRCLTLAHLYAMPCSAVRLAEADLVRTRARELSELSDRPSRLTSSIAGPAAQLLLLVRMPQACRASPDITPISITARIAAASPPMSSRCVIRPGPVYRVMTNALRAPGLAQPAHGCKAW